jgi:hypothetical protein
MPRGSTRNGTCRDVIPRHAREISLITALEKREYLWLEPIKAVVTQTMSSAEQFPHGLAVTDAVAAMLSVVDFCVR